MFMTGLFPHPFPSSFLATRKYLNLIKFLLRETSSAVVSRMPLWNWILWNWAEGLFGKGRLFWLPNAGRLFPLLWISLDSFLLSLYLWCAPGKLFQTVPLTVYQEALIAASTQFWPLNFSEFFCLVNIMYAFIWNCTQPCTVALISLIFCTRSKVLSWLKSPLLLSNNSKIIYNLVFGQDFHSGHCPLDQCPWCKYWSVSQHIPTSQAEVASHIATFPT